MTTKEESGRRIRAARDAKKLTLQDVAGLVEGISPSRLSNWEHGTRMIGVDEAKKLAPVLGTTAEYILTLTDELPNPQEVALLDLYRACDIRGKMATLNTAEKEFLFISKTLEHNERANQPERLKDERRQREQTNHHPERRKIPFDYKKGGK